MRITRVTTRVGDRGNTKLVMGRTVRKDATRIEAYGTVDELNTILGLARTFNQHGTAGADDRQTIDDILRSVQNDLFTVGADLATRSADRWDGMSRVGDDDVARLEAWIEDLNQVLGPLEEFILPGGGPVGAFLHQARTVCRRAERRTVTLFDEAEDIGEGVLRYLNRLSDLLFVLARWAAKVQGEPEYQWDNPKKA